MDDYSEDGKWDEREEVGTSVHNKKSNVLPLWGNEKTMNLNPLILTNIQSSHYFKVNLYELKTYHEVIDEIYYKVSHLEPWEKGSRKTAGQTGMCGGVRGVGAGGIVSTAFCLLYKLFTLKLTRKQLIGLITHPDSPYIRVLGFMYIRYTQPPADLWDWYEPYLDDTEEMDVKAGRGQIMTIGNILKNFLCKLEWFSTLFPRIPVPIQQKLEKKMNERYPPSVPASTSAAGNSRRADVSSRADSHSKYSSPKSDKCNRQDSRDRERSRYSPSRERDVSVRARKSCDRNPSRQRSPQPRNGDRSSSRGGYADKARYEERYQRISSGKDQDRYRRSSERERRTAENDYRKDDDRYGDEYTTYSRKEKKYSHEYVQEKKHQRSETPDRKRSRRRSESRDDSRSRNDDFSRYRTDGRRSSEEKYARGRYKEDKKSRHDD